MKTGAGLSISEGLKRLGFILALALLLVTAAYYFLFYKGDSQVGIQQKNAISMEILESFKSLREVAEQGDTKAQYDLGHRYHAGEGLPKDSLEAADWLRKAAEQGLPIAQQNLGIMYYEGSGVPKDIPQAVEWSRKEAEREEETSQHKLAIIGDKIQGEPQAPNQSPVFVQAHDDMLDNQLIEAVWENNTNLVKELIRQGANVEARLNEKSDGRTALLVAVQNCCYEAAQLLLQQGANPNATFQTGGSGLHYAAATGDTRMIQLLLKHGANPLLKNKSGMTALQEADNAGKHEAIQILKALGDKSDDISFDKMESFIVQTLNGRGIKVFSVKIYPNDYGGKRSYTLEIIYEDRTPAGNEQSLVRVVAIGFSVAETFNIAVHGVEAIAVLTNEDKSRPDKWRAESRYYAHESTEPFFKKWFFIEKGQPCSNQESTRFEDWLEDEWHLNQYDPRWTAKPRCRK